MMTCRQTAGFHTRFRSGYFALMAALVCAGCNSGSATTNAPPADPGTKPTANTAKGNAVATDAGGKSPADVVLDQMIAAYQSAKSYRDNAVLRFTIKGSEVADEQTIPVGVSLERPNRLQCELGGVRIASDGKKLYGSGEAFPGQVVVVPAPKTLHVPTLYFTEALSPLFQEIYGFPIQLDLLAADEPLQDLRSGDQPPALLDPQDLNGASCDRVVFRQGDDEFRLWIDRTTHILRQVDYPFDPSQTVTLELAGAELNAEIDGAAFQSRAPAGEALVRYFVPPPDPRLQPSPLLGKTIGDFTLLDSDGKTIGPEFFRGKITALDIWATWCGPCRQAMPKFDQAAKKYAETDDVQFLAVSVDDPNVDNKALTTALEQIGSDVPWARLNPNDPASDIYARFGEAQIPLYVILGKDRRLQLFHLGSDISVEKLSSCIDKLRAGQDTYQDAAQRWESMVREYEQQIQAARIDGGYTATTEIERADIAKASQPDTFNLTQRWQTTDVKSPGNLLVVANGDGRQILAIDENRHVAALDTAGHVLARHEDLIPKDTVITFLRTASDGNGKRFFLAGGPWQTSLFLFDETFNLLLKYPEANTAEISDAVLADLNGDGTPEMCVAYVGEAGIHGVTLQGDRIWRNRSVSHISDLALGSPDQEGHRRILCTHALGTLAVIDHEGHDLPPIQVRNRSLTNVVAADLTGDGEDELCAIAVGLEASQRTLIGLPIDGIPDWEAEVPGGYHDSAIEPITSAKLSDAEPAYWLYAASDGAIYIYSADGKIRDHFNTGQKLTGLAATTIDGKPAIIAASEDGVTAWAVEKK